jgi:hypothetical protein
VTTRHPIPGGSGTASGDGYRHDTGPSAALLDKVRALDSLPRLGALKTLDLKGNDLRVSIIYLDFWSIPTTDCFSFPRRVLHILPRSSNGIELSKF